MPAFNKVILIGNLTRDPELRYTPKGSAVADIGLAVNRTWTSEAGERKEEVTFIDVTLWGKTAENTSQYCKKGAAVMVEGRLTLEQWDDKQTGQKRQKLKVIGEQVVFLSFNKDGESAPSSRRESAPKTDYQPVGGHGPDTDDDVPF